MMLNHSIPRFLRFITVFATLLASLSSLQAVTWTNFLGNQQWTTAINWSPNTFPNANGAVADFQVDIPTSYSVGVSSGNAGQLLTTLKLGDTNGADNLTIDTGGASNSRLSFTNSTGTVLIEKRGNGNDTIAVGRMQIFNTNMNIVFAGGSGSLTLNCNNNSLEQNVNFVTRVNISGDGTLILGNANSYTGGTVIDRTIVQFAVNTSLGSQASASSITIGNGATLRGSGNRSIGAGLGILLKGGGNATFSTVTSAQTLTINGAISSDAGSPSSFVAAGPGIVSLLGANTFSSSIFVTGGTLSMPPANYTGGGALSLSNATTLTLNLSGNGKLDVSSATLGNGGEVTLNLNYGLLGGNPSNPALNLAGSLNAGATNILLNISGTNFVAGQFPLIDYTGAPLGSIANFKLGTIPPGVIATLVNNTANTSIDLNITLVVNALTWSGGVSDQWEIGGALNWNNGATNYNEYGVIPNINGDVVLFDDTLNGVSLRTNINLTTNLQPAVVNLANDFVGYVFGGAGKLSGSTALNKSGSLPLTINTVNDHTGANTLSQGWVRLGNNFSLGNGTVVFAGGNLSSDSTTDRALTNTIRFTGNVTQLGDAANNGKLTFSGPIDFGNAGRDIYLNNDATFSGTVTNGGLDQKQGPGTLRLQGVTGQMSSGQIQIEAGAVVMSGGAIEKSGGGIRVVCVEPGNASSLVLTNGATITLTATAVSLRIGSGASPVSDASASNIVDISGSLSWTSNNVSGGLIQMGASCILAQLNLRPGSYLRPFGFLHEGNTTELNMDGATIAALSDNPAFLQGLTTANVRSGGVIIDTEGKDITIGQALLNGGGGGGLTKNGLGELTLTGANTYTGNTLVNAGTVLLSPAHLGSGNISVASGATAGFLSTGPGISVTVPSVTVATGGKLQVEFSGQVGNPGTPAGIVSTLTLNGTVPVNVAAVGLTAGTIPLISYTTFNGGGSVALGQLPQGVVATITNNTATKRIELVISGVFPLLWTGATDFSWDVNLTTNWSVNGTPAVFLQDAGVRLDDSAVSSLVFIEDTVTPSSLVISNNALAYTLNAVGANKLSGATGFTKQGTNTLTVGGTHDFTGDVIIAQGKIVTISAGALGSTNTGTIVQSGATLDSAGAILRSEPITISGPGLNGQGALISSVQNQDTLRYVTMAGDASIGGVNGVQWGIQSPSTGGPYLNGNGFKLTKVGNGDVLFKDLGETFLGDIEIIDSAISFQYSSTMGDPLKTCTVQSNGVLAFRFSAVVYNKILVLNNGIVRDTDPSIPADFIGPVTLNGTCQFSPTPVMSFFGPIGGTGTLVKNAAGILVLAGTNTYSGGTVVSNSTLQLAATGSIANSTNIFVDTASTFDVSQVSGFTLTASQIISGRGTVSGNVIANGTVSPGSSVGTLTFANDLTLNGTTVMEVTADGGIANDNLNVSGALAYGGTLQVVLIGAAPLAVNDTFDLFNWGSRSGSFSNLTLPAGYGWDTSQLEVDGTIRVTSVPTQPQFNSPILSGNTLNFSGSGGTPGGIYHVLTSTNVALPLTNWTAIATNNFDGSGNFNFTDTITSAPQRFYLISTP